MAIPYYSMDLNLKELAVLFRSLVTFSTFKGPDIARFQDLIRKTFNIKNVILFPSGRTGFYFLIKNRFSPGDEIIMSIYSFPFFVRLLHQMKIKPVFVDIRPDGLINPDLIEEKITPKTKGILITHLFGNACDMPKICQISRKHSLFLMEDCAHAFGSTLNGRPLGTLGDAAIFSTSPMKVPTTFGGGFVITGDDRLAQTLEKDLGSSAGHEYTFKKLMKLFALTLVYYLNSFPFLFSILTSRAFKYLKAKNPGQIRKIFFSELVASKVFDPFERLKFSNMQAAVGLSQVKRVEEMTSVRREHGKIYNEFFQKIGGITPFGENEGVRNNFLYYVVKLSQDASQFLDVAMDKGVFFFREDCWYCNDYSFAQDYQQDCPVGKRLKSLMVRMPNSSLLKMKHIQKTCGVIRELSSHC